MKTGYPWGFLMLAGLALMSLPAEGAAIRAGLAEVEITPPLGSPMWGYGSRTEGANGVMDPLMAKVLILQTTETTAALVTWETISQIPKKL